VAYLVIIIIIKKVLQIAVQVVQKEVQVEDQKKVQVEDQVEVQKKVQAEDQKVKNQNNVVKWLKFVIQIH